MGRFLIAFLIYTLVVCHLQAQTPVLRGIVCDSLGIPVQDVHISIGERGEGTRSDERGFFQLTIDNKDSIILIISHINFINNVRKYAAPYPDTIRIVLEEDVRYLDQIDISAESIPVGGREASTVLIDPLRTTTMAAPFQDITRLLATLPGVSSPSELSSAYSVRGGNYDENLVYVNNMPVYRPFLVRAGQQEGLSFPNPDLISAVEFSSGGWQASYGDGLSSVMNVRYRKPVRSAASLSAGLLGGSGHIEGQISEGRVSYLVGARHKRAEYLLNTLETKGEYRPLFTDIQSYIEAGLGTKREDGEYRTTLGLMIYYGRNRYNVVPESRETTFGTFEEQLRLFVLFNGQDRLQYDAYQGGLRLSHRFSDKLNSDFYFSGVFTREREFFDVQSAYRLCSIDTDPASSTFDKCVVNLGIGLQYAHGRNLLDAYIANAEMRNQLRIDDRNLLEFGAGYSWQSFNDRLQEYLLIDSAGFTRVDYAVAAQNELVKNSYFVYAQHNAELGFQHHLRTGFRISYLDMNGQWLFSPRIQYSFFPVASPRIILKASTGLYQQQPFYREMRNREGQLNRALLAQSSWHNIAGIEWALNKWGRPFKLSAEVYYKYLWNAVPYDVENVRLRYFGENSAIAYAVGADLRLSGEFIPGEESWFSLGILQTRENIEGDGQGYIPRPTDQLINLNIFFQDHLPNNPSYKMSLNLFYASPLPFSPPQSTEYRNTFRGADFTRVDIGFSKQFRFHRQAQKDMLALRTLWVGLEVLNLTGSQNVISYNWVQDVNSIYYAIPNSLSARFFNIRLTANF